MREVKRRGGLGALTTALAAGGGCTPVHEGPVFERDDVEIEVPYASFRHGVDDEGPHFLMRETITDLNGWMGEYVEALAPVMAGAPIDEPFEDPDGRALEWRLRVDERGTGELALRLDVRAAGEGGFDPVLSGTLASGGRRTGHATVHHDTLALHDDLRIGIDEDKVFAGAITVEFDRAPGGLDKRAGVDFEAFSETREVFGMDVTFSSDESLSFARDEDGAGAIEMAVTGSFEGHGFSGPAVERMSIRAAWNPAGAGRAVGTIAAGEGDLIAGELAVEECFDESALIVWRDVGEPYASEDPGIEIGDEASCAVDDVAGAGGRRPLPPMGAAGMIAR